MVFYIFWYSFWGQHCFWTEASVRGNDSLFFIRFHCPQLFFSPHLPHRRCTGVPELEPSCELESDALSYSDKRASCRFCSVFSGVRQRSHISHDAESPPRQKWTFSGLRHDPTGYWAQFTSRGTHNTTVPLWWRSFEHLNCDVIITYFNKLKPILYISVFFANENKTINCIHMSALTSTVKIVKRLLVKVHCLLQKSNILDKIWRHWKHKKVFSLHLKRLRIFSFRDFKNALQAFQQKTIKSY